MVNSGLNESHVGDEDLSYDGIGELMKCVLVVIVICLLGALFAKTSTPLASAAEVHTVAYMDLDPTRSAEGAMLLVEETLAVKRAPGCIAVDLIKEQGRPNHFISIEPGITRLNGLPFVAVSSTSTLEINCS